MSDFDSDSMDELEELDWDSDDSLSSAYTRHAASTPGVGCVLCANSRSSLAGKRSD